MQKEGDLFVKKKNRERKQVGLGRIVIFSYPAGYG